MKTSHALRRVRVAVNRMVKLGVLRHAGVTGKGGHRGRYSPIMKEDQLKEVIVSKLIESMRANLSPVARS
jgi:predicted transcriptional regulator